jgi:hypothetical protein
MSTNILLLFINFCNSNSPNISRGSSLQNKYKTLELSTAGNFFSSSEIEKVIKDRLKHICLHNAQQDVRILDKLRKSIILEGVIKQKKEYINYLDILLTLQGILRHDAINIPDFENLIWDEIIQLVKNYLILSNAFCQIKKIIYKKDIDTVKAIISLNSIGCGIEIINCNIVINNQDLLLKIIEKGIKNIGGKTFLTILFQDILYVNEFERFLILRQGNQPIQENIEIEIPHGYLFNLAVKHIDEKGNKKVNIKNEFEQIILISKQLCFVMYSVQNYSIWEDIVHKSRESLQYFNDLVVRGTLFDIPQFQATYANQFCNYLLHQEAEEFGKLLPYDLGDLKKVINYLFTLSNKTAIKQFFTIRLVKDLGIELKIIGKILDDLSQNCNEVNSNYFLPTDYLNVTLWEKPLLRAKNGEYILLPKSIIALSFYEAIIGNVRNLGYKKIDIMVGIHIESFIKDKLKTKNINYSCGIYTDKLNGQKEHGEADLVIETNSSIFLFECKKKSLTRKAKSGSNNAIFFDLVASIFDSQLQCYKTESILRINKKIIVKEDNVNTEINWNERTIEKYTFTLSDYGVVQDRLILDQIIMELVGHEFSLIYNGHADENEFSEWEKKINKFSKKREEFAKYMDIIDDSNPFFNSGFLNLHQLMFLIDKSSDNESFYKTVNDSRHVSRGSFDFYQEYFWGHLGHKYFTMKN